MAAKRPAKSGNTRPVPTQADVTFRALALIGLLGRSQGEMEVQRDPELKKQWKQINSRLNQWFQSEGVEPHLSAAEKKVLNKQLGRWTQSEVFNTIWRTEALAALLWALGKLSEMPVYTERVDSSFVFGHIPILEPTKDFVRSVKLRPKKALDAERHAAEFWHWRARTEMLRRQGFVPPEGDTFEACIKRAAESALEEGIIPRVVKGDAPARGKSYGKLTDQEYADAHSVAVERHYALNWVCGYSDKGDWDSTPTDT